MTKNIDIYAGQASNHGTMGVLIHDPEWDVWYKDDLKISSSSTLAESRKKRKEKIEAWINEGKNVKGVRSIISKYRELFSDRIEPDAGVVDLNHLFELLPTHKYFGLSFGPGLEVHFTAEQILKLPALKINEWLESSIHNVYTLRRKEQ